MTSREISEKQSEIKMMEIAGQMVEVELVTDEAGNVTVVNRGLGDGAAGPVGPEGPQNANYKSGGGQGKAYQSKKSRSRNKKDEEDDGLLKADFSMVPEQRKSNIRFSPSTEIPEGEEPSKDGEDVDDGGDSPK
jgi:hypothetical protein